MQKLLQDMPTMRGAYPRLHRILPIARLRTSILSDIVVTTTMKRVGCIIFKADFIIPQLVDLLIPMKAHMWRSIPQLLVVISFHIVRILRQQRLIIVGVILLLFRKEPINGQQPVGREERKETLSTNIFIIPLFFVRRKRYMKKFANSHGNSSKSARNIVD